MITVYVSRILKLSGIVLYTIVGSCCGSQYIWVQKATLPGIIRGGASAFSIGNKGYVGCGLSTSNVTLNDFWEYDPALNSWTQKASLPASGRYSATAFSIGNYGYIGNGWGILGSNQLNDFFKYDPVNNTWTPIANFGGVPRYTTSQFVVNGKAYVGLGFSPLHNDFWEYNPGTNLWTRKANFPGGNRQNCPGFAIGNFGYVACGAGSGLFNDLWQFDPASNSWTQKTSFPGADRYGAAYFAVNGNAFVGCGTNGNQQFTDFYKYDPINDSWCQITSYASTAISHVPCFVINGNGYTSTGLLPNNTMSNETWELTIAPSGFNYVLNQCSTVSFNSQATQPISYLWSFGDSSTSTLANPSHTYSQSGNYQVQLIIYYACGSDTILQNVLVNVSGLAQASFNVSNQPCNLTVSFTNTSINASGFVWDFGDGTKDSINMNPVYTYSSAGTYNVVLIAKDSCGSDTTQITINLTTGTPPTANFSYQQDTCDINLLVNFTNQSLNANSIVWYFGDGSVDSITLNPNHIYSSSGIYNVMLIAKDSCGVDTIISTINVSNTNIPVSDFTFQTLPCDSTYTVNFTNQSSNALSYFWNFGDGSNDTSSNPTHNYSTPSTYSVTLIAFTNCTSDTIQINVVVDSVHKANADFSFQNDVCSGEVGFSNLSTNATNYVWSFGDGSSSLEINPNHNYSLPGSYYVVLTAYSSSLCTDTIGKSVTVDFVEGINLFIPNCFTPNSDGLNEKFEIKNPSNCNDYELYIYNRWGQLIFSTTTLNNSWDGTFDGMTCPEGVYFYILKSTKYSKYGHVTILR